MSRLLATLLLACAVAGVVVRQGSALPLPPRSETMPVAFADYRDFLYLARDRPVLLRLHVHLAGRPYYAAWDDYLKTFFDYFDRDRDGVLNRAEAERLPNVSYLVNQLQGVIGFPYQGQTVKLAEVDTNRDGKVTREEFRGLYRSPNLGGLRVSLNSNQARAEGVTGTLFDRLDTNKDGKLSAGEFARAPEALRRLDLDADEMLTQEELRTQAGNRYITKDAPGVQRKQAIAGLIELPGPVPPGPGILVDAEALRQIVSRYDKNRDGKLTRAEIGLDETAFNKLDANHDGRLDISELINFFRGEPDLEFLARPGKLTPNEGPLGSLLREAGKGLGMADMLPRRAEVFNPAKRAMPLASTVRQEGAETLHFTLADTSFAMFVAETDQSRMQNSRGFYLQRFRQADTANKGVIDLKQAMQVDFVAELFPLADRNGDGKLTRKELTDFIDMQAGGASASVMLSVSDQGHSLFALLDADGDGRLSLRELRTGWTRLGPLARDRAGFAREDIPRHVEVALGQGQAASRNNMARRTENSAGPLWFRKMDRNNDGDLSPNEFLGPEEEFRRLDADGDGLISAAEAQADDARRQKDGAKRR
jgi:Ca2+-binding EF-hand superfamily protein